MEETKEFYKERGLARCLVDGTGMLAVSRKAALKGLLVPALAKGAALAFATAALTQYAGEHVLAAYRMGQAGVPASIQKAALAPSAGEAALLALAVLLPLILHFLFAGQVYTTLAAYSGTGRLEGKWLSALRGGLARRGLRALAVDATFFAAVCAVAATAAFVAAKWGGGVWAAAVAALAAVYLLHAQWIARCLHAFAGKGFARSLGLALGRLWLPLFPLRLLVVVPLAVFGAVALMPVAVYAATVLTAYDSSLLGDGLAIGAGVAWLCGVVNTLCFTVFSLARAAACWPLALGVANAKGVR